MGIILEHNQSYPSWWQIKQAKFTKLCAVVATSGGLVRQVGEFGETWRKLRVLIALTTDANVLDVQLPSVLLSSPAAGGFSAIHSTLNNLQCRRNARVIAATSGRSDVMATNHASAV